MQPTSFNPATCLGLILAGGKSTRMGVEKSLMLLAGTPVLAHVIARFAPQVAQVALNANGERDRFANFALQIIADAPQFGDAGPLAGVIGGLDYAKHHGFTHLATVPCDAPFLPIDLVARLAEGTGTETIAMATGPRGDEPLFALWPIGVREHLRRALGRNQFGVHDFVTSMPHRLVSFSNYAPDAFFNLNRRQDAELAQALLAPDRHPSKL